jgi:hypothetical protein
MKETLDISFFSFYGFLNKVFTVIYIFYLLLSALPILLNFPFISFLIFMAIFCFINPDYRLTRMISPFLLRISEGLL